MDSNPMASSTPSEPNLPTTERGLSRRSALVALAGLGAGAFGIALWSGLRRRQDAAQSGLPPDFRYEVPHADLPAGIPVGQNLRPLRLALEAPRALAAAGETLWVGGAESGAGLLLALAPNGQERARLSLEAPVRALHWEADAGVLWAATATGVARVEATSGAAQPAFGFPTGLELHPTGLTQIQGDIWVADATSKTLRVFGRGGQPKRTLGGGSPAGLRFHLPSPYFQVRSAGEDQVWVNNPGRHALLRLSSSGEVLEKIGGFVAGGAWEGFVGCCNPCAFQVRPDGSIFTAEKGLPRVKRLGPCGELQAIAATPDQLGAHALPVDLAADTSGRLWVLDAPGRTLWVIPPNDTGGAHAR